MSIIVSCPFGCLNSFSCSYTDRKLFWIWRPKRSFTKVDDYDLYALLYADDAESEITPEQALQAAENTNGRVQNNSENTTENSSENTENEEVAEPVQVQKNSMNMNMIYLVIGAVVLVAVGFVGLKFMKKPKKKVTAEDENYDFYDDSDDSDDEE